MRRALPLLLAALAACSPEPKRSFPVGLAGPASPRVAAAAARLGFESVDAAPDGAAVADGALPREAIRLAAGLAAAGGGRGFYVRASTVPAGLDLLDFPEEWQAPAHALRELVALRPVLESGEEAAVPFRVPEGVRARAWRLNGRAYVVLANPGKSDLPLPEAGLLPWRALFEPRADPRDLLPAYSEGRVLPAGKVLWLEGRPL